MAAACSASRTPSSPLTLAAAAFTSPMAWISAGSIGVPLIGKFSTARWVCARHRASRGTWTSPMESCSVRNSLISHGSNVPSETPLPVGAQSVTLVAWMPSTELWPPFALRVTCGPLVMRPLRDADFPEVLAVVHGGIHAPDFMPFSFPWTERDRCAELERQFLQYHWRASGRADTGAVVSWTSVSGTRGRFVGVQGVSTRDFPVTRTGETGSWLGQQFHGRGIGTLMRQAICVLCFDHLGFEEVTSAAFSRQPGRHSG